MKPEGMAYELRNLKDFHLSHSKPALIEIRTSPCCAALEWNRTLSQSFICEQQLTIWKQESALKDRKTTADDSN